MDISFVTGAAGTGKTTWLAREVKKRVAALQMERHQSVLAITRMHGSRRRVESKLRDACPEISFQVSTIDGVALTLVNRWRTSLGYSKPIRARKGASLSESHFGIDADFEQITELATRLLRSNTVRNWWRQCFPVVVVDEFQDCRRSLLAFVQEICSVSVVLLAGDDFQDLNETEGCPAIDWVNELCRSGKANRIVLTDPQRFSSTILATADALRNGIVPSCATVPVFYFPNAGPAAWKIIQTMVLSANRWQGSTALLSCKTDGFLKKVLASCDSQLQKKSLSPIRWHLEGSSDSEAANLFTSLGLDCEAGASAGWNAPNRILDALEQRVISRANRFASLKGIKLTANVVEHHAELCIHDQRAYRDAEFSRLITTIHGAKNREFDNVFVVWTFELPSDSDKQRRLLYNAITRAKKNCIVLVLGGPERFNNDDVLKLLGIPRPVFPPKPKKTGGLLAETKKKKSAKKKY